MNFRIVVSLVFILFATTCSQPAEAKVLKMPEVHGVEDLLPAVSQLCSKEVNLPLLLVAFNVNDCAGCGGNFVQSLGNYYRIQKHSYNIIFIIINVSNTLEAASIQKHYIGDLTTFYTEKSHLPQLFEESNYPQCVAFSDVNSSLFTCTQSNLDFALLDSLNGLAQGTEEQDFLSVELDSPASLIKITESESTAFVGLLSLVSIKDKLWIVAYPLNMVYIIDEKSGNIDKIIEVPEIAFNSFDLDSNSKEPFIYNKMRPMGVIDPEFRSLYYNAFTSEVQVFIKYFRGFHNKGRKVDFGYMSCSFTPNGKWLKHALWPESEKCKPATVIDQMREGLFVSTASYLKGVSDNDSLINDNVHTLLTFDKDYETIQTYYDKRNIIGEKYDLGRVYGSDFVSATGSHLVYVNPYNRKLLKFDSTDLENPQEIAAQGILREIFTRESDTLFPYLIFEPLSLENEVVYVFKPNTEATFKNCNFVAQLINCVSDEVREFRIHSRKDDRVEYVYPIGKEGNTLKFICKWEKARWTIETYTIPNE